ncbi:MAG: septal ring lytic transglycosylase RlpA family protein [Epsilonproteobacteria bacterium]|nr:septal ring lytic transglycosylase RlpA family protein [Campylobacterota bacterium]
MNKKAFVLSIIAILFISGCSTKGPKAYINTDLITTPPTYSDEPMPPRYKELKMRPYVVRGVRYCPTFVNVGDQFKGVASWYGPDFHGKKTCNGETYDMHELTAAHKTLPMHTIVRVTSLNSGKSVVVRINDRGPFVDDRIIDLSKAAASQIDMIGTGTAPVTLEILGTHKEEVGDETQNAVSVAAVDNAQSTFALQIGSFSNINGALLTQQKYDNKDGYKTIIKDVEGEKGRIFKVLLVGFKSEQEARDYKSYGHFEKAFIVRED